MIEITNPVLKQIWKERYQKNGETLEGNLRRVAHYIGENEKEENNFFNVMVNGYFFPAGRTMSNSGIGKHLTLNNCFTVFVGNSMEEIFDAVKLAALTHKAGGGTGFDFSQLSPRNTPTNNDAVASGPISFMDVFNAQTATVMAGNRRGMNTKCLVTL